MTPRNKILVTFQSNKAKFATLGIRKIGLFGSYVRNEQSPKSDIDILVDFLPEKETFDNYMALCDYLESLFADKKIDIVTLNGLSPYIGPKILKEVEYV